jgi:hypothetical protein
MKWFDQWLFNKVTDMWDNRHKYEQKNYIEDRGLKMAISGAQTLDRGRAEGEDRISFELTSAVGGRILNVRRYDERRDSGSNQTYVIPSGEDVGARVAKIINLELIK